MNNMEHGLGTDVKQEADEIVQAHYPAVVMSSGQQCQTISSPPPRQTRQPSQKLLSSTLTSRPSLLSNQTCKQTSSPLERKQPQIFLHSTNSCNFLQSQWMTLFSRNSCLNACTDSCATFESLNTGSLEIGAERKRLSFWWYESVFCGLSVVMKAILFGLLRMELLMGLLESRAGNIGLFIDGNLISIQKLGYLSLVIVMMHPVKLTLVTRIPPRCIPGPSISSDNLFCLRYEGEPEKIN